MKKLVVSLWAAVALVGVAPLWATENGPGGKTWKTVAEMSDAEKVEIDLRTDTPRNPQIPYLPAGKYPFEPPYTAEEMAYRAMEFPHVARWSHAMADSYGSLTSGGFLNQGITIGMNFYIPGNGVLGQIDQTAPGQDYYRMVFYYTFPPEQLGTQELWVLYRTDQSATSKLDCFTYAPSLRRVRRQPQPRRGERFPNKVQSFDDIVGRDAWEFSWRLLGADVIYETVRFPNTRPSTTLANPEGQFTEVPTQQLKMMGDTYPFYAALISLYYDLSLDLLSYSIHDAHLVKEWSAEDRAVMFGPDFMRRGWLMYPLKTQSLVSSPAEFFLRPRLYEGKFPQERQIDLAPDVEARIRAQETAGHLVFDSAVAEVKGP